MMSHTAHSGLAKLVATHVAAGPPWLQQLQNQAGREFQRRGLPTRKEDAFRYTSLTDLGNYDLRLPNPVAVDSLDRDALRTLALPELEAHRLVVVDGRWIADLSDVEVPLGTTIQQASPPPDFERHLQPKGADGFDLLRTALLDQVLTIDIAKGVILSKPIHVIIASSGQTKTAISQPRIFFRIGSGSRVTIIESYVTLTDDSGLCNAGTNIDLSENARLDHVSLVRGTPGTSTVASTRVLQKHGSDYRGQSWISGSQLARHEVHIQLCEPEAHASIDGLAVARGNEQVDNHVVVEHAAPRTQSEQRMAAIVDGSATSSFGGNVIVRRDAQQTHARQQSRSLLLSINASANTQPNLEIYADDVKCSHGATVGQLDEDALFYLRSRGIAQKEAEKVLTRGFAALWLGAIDNQAMRDVLSGLLDSWLAAP